VAIGNGTFRRPTYTAKFNASWSDIERFDQLLAWLDLEAEARPSFFGCYLNFVDSVGHRHGTQDNNVGLYSRVACAG